MRCFGKHLTWLTILFVIGSLVSARAQAPSPSQANQLMQLMLTQPSIDVRSPVVVEAAFDPPAVRPGQKAIYRLTLNAIASNVRMPARIPGPPELEFKPGVQGQMLQPFATTLRPLTAINYEVRARAPGMFLVPSFYIEVYGHPVVVPAAGLEVATDVDETETARELVVQASATNVYVGEALTVQVLLPALPSTPVEAVRDVQINGDGLLVGRNTMRQTIRMIDWHGHKVPAFLYETSVTPLAAGRLPVSAQGFASKRATGGPVVIGGQAVNAAGALEYVLLGSEPLTLNVRMLPSEKELPGFKGAIGQLSCDAPRLTANPVKVGEPVEMLVTVRGDVNLLQLVPPDPPRTPGWQTFPAVNRGYVAPGRETNAGAVFAFTFIPLSDELRATPAIPYSSFDPQRGEFVNLTIPAVPVTVLPDATHTNPVAAIQIAASNREPPRQLTLSRLSREPGRSVATLRPLQEQGWFLALQLLPVLVFGGLWAWERRRRYREQHPEVVRRCVARRELRRAKRQLHRAARAGATVEFTRCGVSALQIVCAPHYPAEPRALVCADILAVLPAEERQGSMGELVRRLFAAANATRFSSDAVPPGDLLGLMPGLNSALLKLEARL